MRFFAGILLVSGLAWAQPSISSVVNAATLDAAISPGCWVLVTGSGLADSTISAAAPLPTVFGGVSVTVNGAVADLVSVSPGRITLVIPPEIAVSANAIAPLIVTTDGTAGRPYNIRLVRRAPGIFTRDGSGTGAALAFSGELPVKTVAAGDTVTLYATGLGPADGKTEKVVDDFEVYLGDRRAEVLLARRAKGMTGLYRIDVLAPVLATDRLYLRSGGWQSNLTTVGIEAGTNVTNVSGSIGGLYPSGGTGSSFALMLHAGTFSTSFDIEKTAAPFDIAAVSEGGAAIVSIDPAASCVNDAGTSSGGTYTASIATLTPAGVRGDFSGSLFPLWDYSTCDPASWVCLAFPLSTIPPPRLPWAAATQSLPAANTITAAGYNAFLNLSGCLTEIAPGGTHGAIGGQNNANLSVFGGFQQLPLGYLKTRVSTFSLYVDGVRIATRDVSYTAPGRP